MLIWNSYWGTWSRILADRFEGWQTVELNLTPVNGVNGNWDREIAPIVIRKHCTARRPKDELASRLPDDWWTLIGERVGRELRHRLLTEDFLPQIDWKKYDSHIGGGGVALADCIRA